MPETDGVYLAESGGLHRIARQVSIDEASSSMVIDGVEFPYGVCMNGPRRAELDYRPGPMVHAVTVTFYAEHAEIMKTDPIAPEAGV